MLAHPDDAATAAEAADTVAAGPDVVIFLAADGGAGYVFAVAGARILVIDEHPEMARPVTDALVARGHLCDLQHSGRLALDALTARREAGRPYQVVIANATLPDLDPVTFMSLLRGQRERCPVILYTAIAHLDRQVFNSASALDARFVDLPIDRTRLMVLVESLRGESEPAPRAPARDQPFFGTGRIARPTPADARYEQPSASSDSQRLAPPMPPTKPEPSSHRTPLPLTGNIVRQGTDRFANQGTVPTTQRIRRDMTGRIGRPPTTDTPDPGSRLRVACATCRREFLVEARPLAYNMVCVHCGQLNRIEPRLA